VTASSQTWESSVATVTAFSQTWESSVAIETAFSQTWESSVATVTAFSLKRDGFVRTFFPLLSNIHSLKQDNMIQITEIQQRSLCNSEHLEWIVKVTATLLKHDPDSLSLRARYDELENLRQAEKFVL
jgi:hypothetical protein